MKQLLQQFNDEISLRGYSERTRTSYLFAINHLFKWVNQPLETPHLSIHGDAGITKFIDRSLYKKATR